MHDGLDHYIVGEMLRALDMQVPDIQQYDDYCYNVLDQQLNQVTLGALIGLVVLVMNTVKIDNGHEIYNEIATKYQLIENDFDVLQGMLEQLKHENPLVLKNLSANYKEDIERLKIASRSVRLIFERKALMAQAGKIHEQSSLTQKLNSQCHESKCLGSLVSLVKGCTASGQFPVLFGKKKLLLWRLSRVVVVGITAVLIEDSHPHKVYFEEIKGKVLEPIKSVIRVMLPNKSPSLTQSANSTLSLIVGGAEQLDYNTLAIVASKTLTSIYTTHIFYCIGWQEKSAYVNNSEAFNESIVFYELTSAKKDAEMVRYICYASEAYGEEMFDNQLTVREIKSLREWLENGGMDRELEIIVKNVNNLKKNYCDNSASMAGWTHFPTAAYFWTKLEDKCKASVAREAFLRAFPHLSLFGVYSGWKKENREQTSYQPIPTDLIPRKFCHDEKTSPSIVCFFIKAIKRRNNPAQNTIRFSVAMENQATTKPTIDADEAAKNKEKEKTIKDERTNETKENKGQNETQEKEAEYNIEKESGPADPNGRIVHAHAHDDLDSQGQGSKKDYTYSPGLEMNKSMIVFFALLITVTSIISSTCCAIRADRPYRGAWKTACMNKIKKVVLRQLSHTESLGN